MIAEEFLGDYGFKAHGFYFVNIFQHAVFAGQFAQKQVDAVGIFGHRQALKALFGACLQVDVGKNGAVQAAHAFHARIAQGRFVCHVKQFELQGRASRVADKYFHAHSPKLFFPLYEMRGPVSTRGRTRRA